MKKLLTSLAVAALALTASADTVKIGVILPLSGNNAQMGELIKPALELFRREAATAKGKHAYELIVEDDQMSPRLTAQAANKLLNVDHVDAIVTMLSSAGNVVAPVAERKGIPHICIAASDETIASKHPHSFVHWIQPQTEAIAFTPLIQKMGKHRVAIIVYRQQGYEAIARGAIASLKQAGIEIVSEEHFNPGERDFRVMLTRIRETNPDVFVPLAFSPELEIVLRQSTQMGITVAKPSIEIYDLVQDLSLVEGQYCVSASRGNSEFLARLKATTGGTSGYGVPFAYNALEFIRTAYEASPVVDHARATAYLSQMKDVPSAVGLISVAANRVIDSPAAYFKIDHGQIVPVTLDQVH